MAVAGQRMNAFYVELFERLINNGATTLEYQNDVVFSKLLQYYTACKESEVSNGKLSLSGYMSHIGATTPTVKANTPHWLDLLAYLGRYGYSGHFLQMEIKQKNVTSYYILVQPHNAALHVELTSSIYEVLSNYTQLSLSGLRVEFDKLESDLEHIVNNTTVFVDYDTVECYNLAELAVKCTEIDWHRALNIQFGRIYEETQHLHVDGLNAIKKLSQYLNNADAKLLTLYTYARFLNYMLAQPYNPLNSNANSYSCVQHMRKIHFLGMNYIYERTHYADQRVETERIIFQEFNVLKSEFANILNANEMQLPRQLVSALLEKLIKMRLNVGNFPINATYRFFDNYLGSLRVGSDFYRNHLLSLELYYKHLVMLESASYNPNDGESYTNIFYTFEHHEPNMEDTTDAATYFYCIANVVIIPYAYLQLPFFDAHFWPALLYGDLANTLGHEMMHAFDLYFIDYDAAGNMRDYTTLLEQNEIYKRKLRHLNDTTTNYLGERLVDISGAQLATRTHLQDVQFRQRNGRLFFLQLAQFFCGNDSDGYHDRGGRRLNYLLKNMPEFAEVFNCSATSPMNAGDKHSFW